MKGHVLGQDQNSREASPTNGTSMAVRQFVDVAFGWVQVHTPTTPFRVEAVIVDERYCHGCFGVRHFDVAQGAGTETAFCRCCGAEFGKGGSSE